MRKLCLQSSLAVGLALSCFLGWVLAAATPANRQPAAPARQAAAPATAPAPTTYPSDQLVAACQKTAGELRTRLDKTFLVSVSPPFVVGGNLSPEELDGFIRHTIVKAADAMWASYFQKKPDDAITVLLFRDESTYRSWAKKLYDDRDVAFYGYYKTGSHVLLMNISTGGGTLVHELTHALIVYDFPDVPQWFNEGLASLHEQCNLGRDGITGLVNWRLKGLLDAIHAGKLRPLRELVTADDFYGGQQGNNYAQARYFCQYMQDKGLLAKFYTRLRENHQGGQASLEAIEHVFGKKADQVEKEYLGWVATLKPLQ
jgi:hypothetical protein